MMIYVALFFVFVFAVALVQSNSNRERQKKIACFSVEAPNRIRIFNDSMRLVETTNNAATFIERVDNIEEFLNWATEQIKNGMPLQMEGNILSVRKQAYELINRNALRVTLAEFAKWNEVPRKVGSRFDKATAGAFEAVDGLLVCLKAVENKSEVLPEMERIRDLIEEIYSDVK